MAERVGFYAAVPLGILFDTWRKAEMRKGVRLLGVGDGN